jgi:F-type H+-transporting ATPase subunit gamma
VDRPRALSNLTPNVLLDGLIAELLFAQLAHAATESFASENAARLASMESAADNVTGKLDDLRRIERELRQEEITTELLDIVTGAEAIAQDSGQQGASK